MSMKRLITIQPSVTPTLDTDAYTANDVLGGLITLKVCQPGGSGTLRHVAVTDDGDDKAALKIHVFNAAPTAIADDAAFAPLVADLKKRIGRIQVNAADYVSWNGNAQAFVRDANIEFETATGYIYFYVSCDATPTYAAADLTFVFTIWLD